MESIGSPPPSEYYRHQIFTPTELCQFMAGMFESHSDATSMRLLDPGAGTGALTESVLERFSSSVNATLIEKDRRLFDQLIEEFYIHNKSEHKHTFNIINSDFISSGIEWIKSGVKFTHAILNPPYERIMKDSFIRNELLTFGIKTPNIYSAFLWISWELLRPGGEMVAVVPRSMLSGRQFKSLRKHLGVDTGTLRRVHHFRDRRAVFGRDAVQQEVVVLKFKKSSSESSIAFSASDGLHDLDSVCSETPRSRLIPSDHDDFIVLIPRDAEAAKKQLTSGPKILRETNVSVGSVVDFRLTNHISDADTERNQVILIGSEYFSPSPRAKRWLSVNSVTRNHVYPPGTYIVVKRISPPEAHPRLRMRILDAQGENFDNGVAFENHVIVVHDNGRGLSADTGAALWVQLHSNEVEEQIAERTGSTQINVSDLLALKQSPESENRSTGHG